MSGRGAPPGEERDRSRCQISKTQWLPLLLFLRVEYRQLFFAWKHHINCAVIGTCLVARIRLPGKKPTKILEIFCREDQKVFFPLQGGEKGGFAIKPSRRPLVCLCGGGGGERGLGGK